MFMKLRILYVRRASNHEWDETWQTCDYATYFHSREWAEVWEKHSPESFRPEPRRVLFSDGNWAIVVLFRTGQRPDGLKEYMSSLHGTYGGWISRTPLSLRHRTLLTDYMLKQCGNLYWRVNPYDENIFKVGVKKTSEETHAINLQTGFDTVRKQFSRGNISSTQKARKLGVAVKVAEDLKDWRAYYGIYEDSLRRWGDKASSRYEWELFEEFFRRRSQHIRLWLANVDETVVAGALCFYAKTHVVYWHGATLESHFAYRPMNLLMAEIIRNSCEQGYSWFDFNPSGGHEGVKAFKLSFGVQALPCPVVCAAGQSQGWLNRLLVLVGKE